ncbi:MAG: filamentous hemagglutinin N-terminal domain-containing protein, partial [Oleiphilaceae bacterium]|nr:filamentous hemagglutinin N-terminal domain-containing protein [Oleiphilaceae bacterium]
MNKVFSIVWNHALQSWVVASELTPRRGKRGGAGKKAMALILGGTLSAVAQAAPPASNALPSHGQVASGQVSISQTSNTMTIHQSTQKGIINWQSFNIGSDATVNFQQPDRHSATLNRVNTGNASKIYGNLNANGQVFLINPSGVLFGQGARVDVGGLVASTLNLRDGDFLSGYYQFRQNGAGGSVVNEGELIGQYIAMLAPEVRNQGVVIARQGTVAMAAGEAITLNIAGHQLIDVQVSQATFDTLVENRHLIQAEEGLVILSAQSASQLLGQTVNSGQIAAGGMVSDGGRVRLVASSQVSHSGDITVDGGIQGQGGEAILLASLDNPTSRTDVSGRISARGGSQSGHGGFIETSANQVRIADSATVDTRADQGETGQWLIDPVDFTIGVNGDITGAALSNQLSTSNITIESVNGANEGNGDIFVNDSLSWSDNALTLSAERHIEINAPISVSGTGGLNLEFAQSGSLSDSLPPLGDYFVKAPVTLASGASFTTKYASDGETIQYTVLTDETDLLAIDSNMTGNYVLGTSIALSTNPWAPLGNASGDVFSATAFDGYLDGLGHEISGLTRSNTDNATGIGLFGRIGPMGFVRNLGLTNVDLAGLSSVGALAGQSEGLISNVYATGNVKGSDATGVGPNPGTNDDLVGEIGGLVGNNFGFINNSYSAVNVEAITGEQGFDSEFDGGIGGLVGINNGVIDNSYATGSVNGLNNVGGLVGATIGSIVSSFSSGAVSGATNFGGLVGGLFTMDDPFGGPGPELLSDTYWNIDTSGQTTSASDANNSSTGLTTAEALQQSSYGFFDFTNTWVIYDGISAPLLRSMLTPYFVTA